MEPADVGAFAIPALCELAWGAVAGLQNSVGIIAEAIRRLMNDAKCTVVNRSVQEAGLAMLDAGGDFADGASLTKETGSAPMPFVVQQKGGETGLEAQGISAQLLSGLMLR